MKRKSFHIRNNRHATSIAIAVIPNITAIIGLFILILQISEICVLM